MNVQAAIVLAALTLASCASAQDITRYRDPTLSPDLAFSSAVMLGDTIHVAGHIGILPGTVEIAPGGVGAETAQMLENVRATLQAVGADLSDIVACTIYLTDLDDFAAVNAAYAPFFPDGYPARAAIGVNELVLGASVELACVARRPGGEE